MLICLNVIVCFLLQNGDTALIVAARNGYDGIVSHLINRGADINSKDKVSTYIYIYIN